MRTRSWIILIAGILAVCLAVSVFVWLPWQEAAYAEVYSNGELLCRLDLSQNTERKVVSAEGTNVITVHNGKLAVTWADCPDGYCVQRGWCSSGMQIVCLPHRLVIKFVGRQSYDGVTG